MHRKKERQKPLQKQLETAQRLLPPTGELLKQVSVVTQIENLKISGKEIKEIEDADFKKIEKFKDERISDPDIEWLKEMLDKEVRSLLCSKYAGKKYLWEVSLLATNGSGIYAAEGYYGDRFVFTSIGIPWLGRWEENLKKYRFGENNLKVGPLFHDFGEDTGFSWYAKYEVPELDAEVEQEYFFFNNGKFIPYITYKGPEIDCIPLTLRFGIPKYESLFPMVYSPWDGVEWHRMPLEFKTPAQPVKGEGFSVKVRDFMQNIEILINPCGNGCSDAIQFVLSGKNHWFDYHPDECLKGGDMRRGTVAYVYLINKVSCGTHGPWLLVRQV